MCEMAQRATTVIIQPFIAHLPNGQDMVEVGVGGGGDDLQREAELDYLDQASLEALLEMFVADQDANDGRLLIHHRLWSSESLPEEARNSIVELWTRASSTGRTVHLDHGISSVDDKISLTEMAVRMAKKLREGDGTVGNHKQELVELPKLIHFPYSRHSSYPELCQLVDVFQPKDVWPCTVDPMDWFKNGD
jgi:DNA cross-link repair 1C protein